MRKMWFLETWKKVIFPLFICITVTDLVLVRDQVVKVIVDPHFSWVTIKPNLEKKGFWILYNYTPNKLISTPSTQYIRLNNDTIGEIRKMQYKCENVLETSFKVSILFWTLNRWKELYCP